MFLIGRVLTETQGKKVRQRSDTPPQGHLSKVGMLPGLGPDGTAAFVGRCLRTRGSCIVSFIITPPKKPVRERETPALRSGSDGCTTGGGVRRISNVLSVWCRENFQAVPGPLREPTRLVVPRGTESHRSGRGIHIETGMRVRRAALGSPRQV